MKITFNIPDKNPVLAGQIAPNIYFIGRAVFKTGGSDSNVWVFKTDEISDIYRVIPQPFSLSRLSNVVSIKDYKEVNLELLVTEKSCESK